MNFSVCKIKVFVVYLTLNYSWEVNLARYLVVAGYLSALKAFRIKHLECTCVEAHVGKRGCCTETNGTLAQDHLVVQRYNSTLRWPKLYPGVRQHLSLPYFVVHQQPELLKC